MGFPYAESHELLELWQVRSVDPLSKQVVVRASYMIDWIDRPWMVDKLISTMAHNKVEKQVAFFSEF